MGCLTEFIASACEIEKRTKPTGCDVRGDKNGRTARLELAKNPVTFTSVQEHSVRIQIDLGAVIRTVPCLREWLVPASRLDGDT